MGRNSPGFVSLFVTFTVAMPVYAAEADDFFENRVRSILANKCYSCNTNSQLGGLRMDSRESLLKGGKSGPAISRGDAEKSLLIRAVKHVDERLKMPLGKKLADREIEDLTAWVAMGAP